MPGEWEDELKSALCKSAGITWGLHTPQGRTSHNFEVMHKFSKQTRIQNFYNDLGGQTQLLIGYPSELVSVVCELRARGVPVWMITLPPSGAHELRNLKFAVENNLILGEFTPMNYDHPPTLPDLEPITSAQLSDVWYHLPKTKWSEGIIGSKPFWHDLS
jgi:hypothetical protein